MVIRNYDVLLSLLLQREKKKVLSSQTREVVCGVRHYFELERVNKDPLSPFRKVVERVAAATRISQSTVKIVSREMDEAQAAGSSQL